jgi:hypothetical protein
MKKCIIVVGSVLLLAAMASGQTKTDKKPRAQPPAAQSSEEMNIRAYIELLRSDVRKEKATVVAQVMEFSAGDAAKFWPIYKEYDAAIVRTGDAKLAGIKKYAENYSSMTDAVADELAHTALKIEQQRNDIKSKYYERVKQELGAITAARFLQVENQLLMLLDLQVAASLPVIQPGVER